MTLKSFQGMLTNNKEEANIVTLGIPYDLGLSPNFRGSAKAPDVLREVSSNIFPTTINGNKIENIKIYDYGDTTGRTLEEIYSQTRDFFSSRAVKLVFGGDHSISIPIQQKFIEKCEQNNQTPVIIHLDAEPNLCDFYEGSFTSRKCVLRRAKGRGVKSENLYAFGVRGFANEEIDYLVKHPHINVYKVTDLQGNNLMTVVNQLCEKYKNAKDYAIYLSFSATVLDLPYAPGVSVPTPFGLKPKGAISIMENIVKNTNVRVIDVVDVNPLHDQNNITSYMVMKSLYEVLYQLSKKGTKDII